MLTLSVTTLHLVGSERRQERVGGGRLAVFERLTNKEAKSCAGRIGGLGSFRLGISLEP